MGDGIWTGRMTDCRFSPFSGLKLHSQHCTLAYSKKVNKMQPVHVSSPLNYPPYFHLLVIFLMELLDLLSFILIVLGNFGRLPLWNWSFLDRKSDWCSGSRYSREFRREFRNLCQGNCKTRSRLQEKTKKSLPKPPTKSSLPLWNLPWFLATR